MCTTGTPGSMRSRDPTANLTASGAAATITRMLRPAYLRRRNSVCASAYPSIGVRSMSRYSEYISTGRFSRSGTTLRSVSSMTMAAGVGRWLLWMISTPGGAVSAACAASAPMTSDASAAVAQRTNALRSHRPKRYSAAMASGPQSHQFCATQAPRTSPARRALDGAVESMAAGTSGQGKSCYAHRRHRRAAAPTPTSQRLGVRSVPFADPIHVPERVPPFPPA